MNPKTPLNKSRLRTIRKFLRSGPATQAQVAELFGIDQKASSLLMRHLMKIRHVKVSHKESDSIGRRAVIAYELTDHYLATIKPEISNDSPTYFVQPIDFPMPPESPSMLTRLKDWLFGKPKEVAA